MPHPFESLQLNKANLARLLSSLTTGIVTSWSAGSTGLTPSAPTGGAVALGGTLNAASGGTGLASYAIGDTLYASGTTALSRLTAVVTGNALISGGVATAPAWGKILLTSHVTGTLAVANGGTGVTTSTGSTNVVLSASPALTGTPTAPTAAAFNNSTQLATTAYADRVGVQQVVSTITGAVATGATVLPVDDTIPQNNEGDQYMSLAITPKSATSTLVIEVVCNGSSSAAGGNYISAALFQDSTANALAVCPSQAGHDYRQSAQGATEWLCG